jgi:3-oxoacyl-[acyl-carrier protein] reductase
MTDLQGKVAVVTGGSRGIGRSIALALGNAGAKVAVTCMQNREAAEDVVAALRQAGSDGCVCQFDIADFEETAQALDDVVQQLGSLDILVANAGVRHDQLLIRMKPEEWQAVLQTNLSGLFHSARAATRVMIRQRWGRIIAISSIAGLVGNAGQTNYAASKAGMIGFVKALAKEVASRGITVNAVAPGMIDTDMTRTLTEAQRQTLVEQIPSGGLGTPEDVAACVLFLASEGARYITGEVVSVSGGLTM